MKQCLKCYKTYADDTLNFCLEDGEMLVAGVVVEPPKSSFADDSPPTMVINEARRTDPINWPSTPPAQGWQPQGMQQQYGGFQMQMSPSQTLAVVSLGLGIASMTIGWCCYLGVLLSPAALITGFIALSQIKKNPDRYTGRGLAIGGIATAAAYLALLVIFFIIWGVVSLGNLS